MGDGLITETRFDKGRWVAFVSGTKADPARPEIGVFLNGQDLGDVSCSAEADGRWKLEFQIPSDVLADGVSTFLFVERKTSRLLGRFCVVAGELEKLDVLAQLDVLQSELDQLKSAFRREVRDRQSDH